MTESDDTRKGPRWEISAWQEWSAWFRPGHFNWSTFTFVQCYVESTRYRGLGFDNFEIHVALLGFNLMVEYFYDPVHVEGGGAMRAILESVDEWKANEYKARELGGPEPTA